VLIAPIISSTSVLIAPIIPSTSVLIALSTSDCYSHPTQGYRLLDSGALSTGVKKIAGLPVQGASASICSITRAASS